MSMILMAKAMNIKVRNPLRKLVLIKLADSANDKGECWPSYQHIAEQCEMSKCSVMRHILQLEKDGLLRREHRKGAVGIGSESGVCYLALDSAQESSLNHNEFISVSPKKRDYSFDSLVVTASCNRSFGLEFAKRFRAAKELAHG